MKTIIKKQLLIGKDMKNTKFRKILMIITICSNLLLLYKAFYWLYCYNFTDVLYLIMYSTWELLTNILFGIIGIVISIMLYKRKINIKLFLIITLVLWIITLSIYIYPNTLWGMFLQ